MTKYEKNKFYLELIHTYLRSLGEYQPRGNQTLKCYSCSLYFVTTETGIHALLTSETQRAYWPLRDRMDALCKLTLKTYAAPHPPLSMFTSFLYDILCPTCKAEANTAKEYLLNNLNPDDLEQLFFQNCL